MKTTSLKRITKKILNDLDSRKISSEISELSVVLTSNRKIKELNKRFRRKNYSTDVLSFSQVEGTGNTFGNVSLGDIVISLEKTREQALERKISLHEEILRLLIHGILHLFGHDHENVSRNKALKMRRIEDNLFSRYAKLSRELLHS